MLFEKVIGQKSIKERLIRSAKEGRIAHAQLFCGAEGCGALPLALAYAQYICCENPTETDSCGKCPSCQQFEKLTHPDIHFEFPIVGSSMVCDNFMKQFRNQFTTQPYTSLNQWLKSIGEDGKQCSIYSKESEEIVRKLSFKPYESKYKVMLIWLPEKMNITCANNLLKLLEEPPAYTIFLLVSEKPETLLPTILSRTQRIDIPPIDDETIAKSLIEYFSNNHSQINNANISLSETDAKTYAKLSKGNYVKAIELSSHTSDNAQYLEFFMQLMRTAWGIRNFSSIDKKGDALIQLKTLSENIAKIGRERQKSFLEYCQRMVRENFVNNFHLGNLNNMTDNESEFSKKFSPFVNEKNVIGLMEELSTAQRDIEQNGQAKIVFYDLALKFIMLMK